MNGSGQKVKYLSNVICRNCHVVWPISVEVIKMGKNWYWDCGTCGKMHHVIRSKRRVPFQTKTSVMGKDLLGFEMWVVWDFNTGEVLKMEKEKIPDVPEWKDEYEPR